ncbi:MAG: hypothetical protein MI748_10130 [Opitutales bacterium]|nr:hypothetical protein [Opitutales bacterium]
MDYPKRIYAILYPNAALVASQLTPEQFSKHYISGSNRHYDGKMIFAEIDPNFRHPYFKIDETLKEVVPHEDGRPKSTKFISTYRVLEHLDLDAIQSLTLTTAESYCLTLQPEEMKDEPVDPDRLRVYAEIAPLRMLALATHSFKEFGQYITDPSNAKGAPTLFYTQLSLAVDEFLEEFDENPMTVSPIPGLHPSKLRDAIEELRTVKTKNIKGVSLHSSLRKVSYRMIENGFMFARGDKTRFFPIPDLHEIEDKHYKFWRHM